MKPPDDEPSALFAKLLEMPRPTEVIDFPRNDAQGQPVGRVRVQILTSKEHDDAREKAHAWLKKRGITNDDMTAPALREVLGDAIAKELIAMACLTEKDYGSPGKPTYARMFRNARDVDALGADEIVILFYAYELVQKKYGPFERNLSPEDIDAWVQRLGEGGAEFPLLSLALPQLVLLAQSLGARLYSLSRILESQLETLPTTLVSQLRDSYTGIGSAGAPAAATSAPGSASRADVAAPITTETAVEMANRLRQR